VVAGAVSHPASEEASLAEIGLGKGAGVGTFASGFGKGLSQALLMNRERSDQKSREEQARKDRLFQTMLPVYLQNAEDVADLEPLLQSQFPEVFTQGKKGGKKGDSPFDKIAHFLGPLIGMRRQQTIESGWPGGPVTMSPGGGVGMGDPGMSLPGPTHSLPPAHQPPGVSGGVLNSQPQYGEAAPPPPIDQPPDISQTPYGGAAPAAAKPARRTLFGVPLMTEEDRIQRDTARATAGEEAQVQGKVNVARRLIAQGMPAEEAYDRVGLRSSTTGRSAEPFQSVPGETADGKPAFGVFDQTRGLYLDPITKEPIPGFRPKSAASSGSQSEFESFLGAYAKDHNKTIDQLSPKERLDARSEWAKAGSTAAQKPEDKDPMALARLAVRQPQVLQGLTPTVTGSVMAAIASDPQLSAQYETARMEPVRNLAQTALTAIDDLLVTDPNTGAVKGLTPGASGLYELGMGRLYKLNPGGETATAKAALDQVTGQLTLDLLKEMKAQSRTGATGFGQLSGRELSVLESAATVLKGEISRKRALQELTKLRERFQKILEPGGNEIAPSAGQTNVGPITLDTPVFIGPDGKPRIGGSAGAP